MRIGILIFSLFGFIASWAQNKPLLYNVDDLPQTLMSNPGAEINFKGHIGVPFFSQIHLSGGMTGVNIHDIFSDDNPDVNTRVRNVIRNLSSRDYFVINENVEIISLGWKLDRNNYLSVGVYQEMDAFAYFPKDIAILANEGNNNYLDKPFDFSHFSMTGEVLTAYHVGLNRKINNRLTVGARAKLYSGIFNVKSTGNTGVFRTVETPGGPNVYRHYAENIDVVVNTSGFASLNQEEDMTVKKATTNLLKRSLLGGNIGAGLDLGFTYMVNDEFIVTGAAQDIGLMFQREDVENYLYYGEYYTDGIEPLFPDLEGNQDALPYWDIFEDDVDAHLIDETLQESYITWRPVKFNTSVEYGFGRAYQPCNYLISNNSGKVRYVNLVGMQLAGVRRPKGMVYALSSYWDHKITDKLRFKIAYTLDDYSYTNLGLMVSSTFNKFNVYLATENILGYTNLAKTNNVAIQFGMQLIFGDL